MTLRGRWAAAANRRVLALADAVSEFGLPREVRNRLGAFQGSAGQRIRSEDQRVQQLVALGLTFGWAVVAVALAVVAIAADQLFDWLVSPSPRHVVAFVMLLPVLAAGGTSMVFAARLLRFRGEPGWPRRDV